MERGESRYVSLFSNKKTTHLVMGTSELLK